MENNDYSLQNIVDELLRDRKLTSKQRGLVLAFDRHRTLIQPNELLRILSFYFNEGWKRTTTNEGFFLIHQEPVRMANDKYTPSFRVQSHKSVVLPGIVYFKSHEACNQAMKIFQKVYSIFELY